MRLPGESLESCALEGAWPDDDGPILHAVLDAAVESILLIDLRGHVLYCNKTVGARFGRTVIEMLGQCIYDFLPTDLAESRKAACNEALRTGQPVIVEDERAGIVTTSHITPLYGARGEAIGLVVFAQDITARKEAEKALKRTNENLEQRVSERAAEAEQRSAQLRAMAAEMTLVEQRERRQLAHMLHDDLQQLLVAARLQLAGVDAAVENEEAVKIAVRVDELLQQSISKTRTLTAQLSPRILYEQGLAAALEWLAAQAEEKYRLRTWVEATPGAEPAEEEIKMFLFAAVRELLLNVAKHASAQHVWLTISRTGDGWLRVAVDDDGIGFAPDGYAAANQCGFGLFSIRERLDLLSGRMEINSAPGKGTEIALLVPSRDAASS
jgi:PAS domain S-box-containing protein